jgi:hypothetical protein
MSTLQIESADVVKLVLQFLKENNLHKTFAVLQVVCVLRFDSRQVVNLSNQLAFPFPCV